MIPIPTNRSRGRKWCSAIVHWGGRMPLRPPLGEVVATRTGIGGVVGQKRKYFSGCFAADFTGCQLATLAKKAEVEPVTTASRGEVEITSARPQLAINGYRAIFDLKPTDDSVEPIDLRLYLRLDGQALTETTSYKDSVKVGADLRADIPILGPAE